jgi:hypothetical protein
MQMKKILGLGAAVMLAVLSLVSLTGCNGYDHSGNGADIETRKYDYSGFKRIEVSNAFVVDVTRSDTYNISATMNKMLFNYLNVLQNGDTLVIYMNPNTRMVNNKQLVSISLPELDAMKISGACQGTVTGFQSDGTLDLEVNSASRMEIMDLKAVDTTIKVIGVSQLSGSLVTGTGDFEVTGASNIKLQGSAETMQLKVVGASYAKLQGFPVNDASVTAEGAATAEIEAHGTLDIDVSGVSTLIYSDNPKLGRVEVSGASTLKRR